MVSRVDRLVGVGRGDVQGVEREEAVDGRLDAEAALSQLAGQDLAVRHQRVRRLRRRTG